MDTSKCLVNICFITYSTFLAHGYGADVKLDLMVNGVYIDSNIMSPMTVMETPGRVTLTNLIGGMMERHGVKMVATASPLPTDVSEECFFVVGFLSPLESVNAKPFPNRQECERSNLKPTIAVADEILAYPRCIKYAELEQMDFTKVIGEHRRTHCGMYRLVGMLDPLREVEGDTNFCNNYITFDINFNCSSQTVTEPTCDLLPMGTDDNDVTLLYMNQKNIGGVNGQSRRLKHAMHMFRQGEMSPEWNEEYEKENDVVRKYGKMVIRTVRAYMQGLPKENYLNECSSENNAADWVKRQLNEFQGLTNKSTLTGTNVNSDIMLRQILAFFKRFVGEINDETKQSNLVERLQSEIDSHAYMNAGEQTNVDAMRKTISEIIDLVRAQKQSVAKKHVTEEVCGLANRLERFMKMSAQTHNLGDIAGVVGKDIHGMISNTSALAVKLMYFYPEFYDTCYENLLLNLHATLKQGIQSANFTWMRDRAFLQRLNEYRANKTGFPFNQMIYQKLQQGCGKSNGCIRKMKSMCRNDQPRMANGETVETMKEDVCKMKRLKEIVSKHEKNILNNNMKELGAMQKDPFDAVCYGDDKMSVRNQMPLTRMEKGIVKRGHLDLENKMVSWQPIARCTCDHCDKRPLRGGEDHAKPEFDDQKDDKYDDSFGYKSDDEDSDSSEPHSENGPGPNPDHQYGDSWDRDETRPADEKDGETTDGDEESHAESEAGEYSDSQNREDKEGGGYPEIPEDWLDWAKNNYDKLPSKKK